MTLVEEPTQHVGRLLRRWRESRRLSQLELAVQAGVSARHLSFLETGRSRPSREMVLRLADELQVPLRERNPLLVAAGFAPAFAETPLAAPPMSAVRGAIRQLLTGHDPYPAVVFDSTWNVVEANDSFRLFTDGAADEVLAPPVNVLRLALHPKGMAPRIVNLGQWRSHVLTRLRQRLAREPWHESLFAELSAYPCDQPEPPHEIPVTGDIFVPLQLRHDGRELRFFAVFATFGGARDITVAELTIESFFPADDATARALRAEFGRD